MNRLPFLLHLVKAEESSVLLNNFWEHKSQNVPFWGNVSIWKEDWPDFLLHSAHLHRQSHRHCTLAHQRHLPNKKGLLSISNEVLQDLWCNQGLQKIHLYCNQALFALACPVGLHSDISQHHPIFFNAAFNCFCLGPLSLSSKRSLWAISAVKDVIWTFILNSQRYSEQHLETLSLSSKSWKLKWR